MAKIINLTSASISIAFHTEFGAELKTIPASGQVAKVSTKEEFVGYIDGVPVTKTVFGEIEGLPEPEEGVMYLISSMVAQYCQGRDDILVPNGPVYDGSGNIVGCGSLGKI